MSELNADNRDEELWKWQRISIELLSKSLKIKKVAFSDPVLAKFLEKLNQLNVEFSQLYGARMGRESKALPEFSVKPLINHIRNYFYSDTQVSKKKNLHAIKNFCEPREIPYERLKVQLDRHLNSPSAKKVLAAKKDFEALTYKVLEKVGHSYNSRNTNIKYAEVARKRSAVLNLSARFVVADVLKNILRLSDEQVSLTVKFLESINYNLETGVVNSQDVAPELAKTVLPIIKGRLSYIYPKAIREGVSSREASKIANKITPSLVELILETIPSIEDDLPTLLSNEVRSLVLSQIKRR